MEPNTTRCSRQPGRWSAVLVEGNPRFAPPLQKLAEQYPGAILPVHSSPAYRCDTQVDFFIDTVNGGRKNYWGSSLAQNHPDVIKSGKAKASLRTSNVQRLLVENSIREDWVVLK